MLKKLQALKAKKGFTLVELIVVIAIIAVLAAILVPTLLNQVTNSRIVSADSTATTIRDTINAWIVQENANNGTLIADTTDNSLVGTGASITIGTTDLSSIMSEAYDFTGDEHYIVIIQNHKVKAVAYCANAEPGVTWDYTNNKWSGGGIVNNNIVGTCPKAST